MPDDANQMYFDAALRHQIGLRRFTSGEIKRMLELLERADRDLAAQLRERLPRFLGRTPDFTTKRWRSMISDFKDMRTAMVRELRDRVQPTLFDLSKSEAETEMRLITTSVPIEITLASAEVSRLREAVTQQPFQGRNLGQWFQTLGQNDQRRLLDEIAIGVTQQETIDDVVRRIVGTRALGYTDGVLAVTRREATTVVRTAINHVSNSARERVWEANDDIISGLRWTSTLDGRTSAICRARDGHMVPYGDEPLPAGVPLLQPPGARPPAHPNCRSVMVAVLDGVGILGDRPSVTDTRTRGEREIDFREEARRTGRSVKDVRNEWADRNIGTVPAATTYQKWLSRQPAAFQDQVLGKAKGKLFRKGGLTLDQFVDRQGNELTLDQLRATRPEAFRAAGIAA